MQSYPAVYQDQQGLIKTKLYNDFTMLSMQIRGATFEGAAHHTMQPAHSLTEEVRTSFTFYQGHLSNFSLFYQVPIDIIDTYNYSVQTHPLEIKIRVGSPTAKQPEKPKIALYVALYFDNYLYRTKTGSPSFRQAFDELHLQIPEAYRLKCCFTCAFSSYHPQQETLFGNMLCFKKRPSLYNHVKNEQDLIGLIQKDTHDLVQETFLCPTYKLREEES
ncbi:MAG: DUF6304 family protein [Thermonemataceae bacterium]